MRFAVVELSSGIMIRTGRDFEKMKREVESSSPSRWDNPVLIVIPDKYRPTHEEGEVYSLGELENLVVAVPESGWGYGAEYMSVVNRNRRKFGLPGIVIPSSGTLRLMKERAKLSGMSPDIISRGFVSSLEGEEDREEFFRRLLESEEEVE